MPPFVLPFDPVVVSLGGFPLIPTVIYIIQGIKSFVPTRWSSKTLWRSLALIFGALGMVAAHLKVSGAPTEWYGWLVLVLSGLVFGFIATRAYDKDHEGEGTALDGGLTRLAMSMAPNVAARIKDFYDNKKVNLGARDFTSPDLRGRRFGPKVDWYSDGIAESGFDTDAPIHVNTENAPIGEDEYQRLVERSLRGVDRAANSTGITVLSNPSGGGPTVRTPLDASDNPILEEGGKGIEDTSYIKVGDGCASTGNVSEWGWTCPCGVDSAEPVSTAMDDATTNSEGSGESQ